MIWNRLPLVLTAIVFAASAWAASPTVSKSLPTDRGRIKVATTPDPWGGPPLKVLRTDAGTPIRSGTAWIWSKQFQEEPADYYAEMRSRGLNAVRIVLFDTWEREAGYGGGDWNDETYRTAMLARIERAVNFASENGMYAIVNSHNKVPQYDEDYNLALWKHVAPHFSGRTHVLYEATNEALEGANINKDGLFSGSVDRLKALRRNYDLIRKLAPETHIMVLTPAGVSGWGFIDGMNRLVKTWLDTPGGPVDWTKTSVAYHLYHADEKLFPLAENLRRLHNEYPGWPSENSFPYGVTSEQLGIPEGDSWRAVSFGSHSYVTQTCEKLGLGWSHWHLNRMTQLERNFPLLWADATAKGYAWKPDPVSNSVRQINAGGTKEGRYIGDINFFGGKAVIHQPLEAKSNSSSTLLKTARTGAFRYVFAKLPRTKAHTLRLHFNEADTKVTKRGERVFDVKVNGKTLISKLDVFASAKLRHHAEVIREIAVKADSAGRIEVEFVPVTGEAIVSALSLSPAESVR